ncbi:MAG: glycosyltransferase family 9 protein [Candidatus Kapabacteria bacterium]|nr:glycosyltransferase family 9 protein [Candidatus Kapabacteria bacterium]
MKQILQNIKKIAIFRTDRIGDMVLTLPMFRAVKQIDSGIHTTLIASAYVSQLVENCDFIDERIYLDSNIRINKILKQIAPDAIFFPRPKYNEALAAFLARVPKRIGSAYRLYSLLFNHRVYSHRKTAQKHEAEYNVELINRFFETNCATELVCPNITPNILCMVDKKIIEKVGASDFIILHPGTGGSAGEWSAENFAYLGQKISNNFSNIKIAVTGSDSDFNKCEIIKKIMPEAISFCSDFKLEELIAFISRSKLLVANSTGVLHLAASLAVPVVGIYPNSSHLSAKRWGPYSINSVTISPPETEEDQKDNLNLVKVDDVYDKVKSLLQSNTTSD